MFWHCKKFWIRFRSAFGYCHTRSKTCYKGEKVRCHASRQWNHRESNGLGPFHLSQYLTHRIGEFRWWLKPSLFFSTIRTLHWHSTKFELIFDFPFNMSSPCPRHHQFKDRTWDMLYSWDPMHSFTTILNLLLLHSVHYFKLNLFYPIALNLFWCVSISCTYPGQ